MKIQEQLDKMDSKLDRIENKLDHHMERIISSERDLHWLKGFTKIVLTLVISALSGLVAYFTGIHK